MKIIELKSSNIKKIKAVELKFDEKQNLVMITGKNAAGKTSLIDSIWYALGGRKAAQDKPIREGEKKGEITIDLDGYIVTRTFTSTGSYLKIINKDGSKYSNPQEFLDFIIGNLSFDPLAFSRLDARNQVSELTKVVGLDLSGLDEKKKKLTEERVLVGREGKVLAQHSEEHVKNAGALKDEKEVSVAELSQQLEEANAEHSLYKQAQLKMAELQIAIESSKAEIIRREKTVKDFSENKLACEKTEDTKVDIADIKHKIESAETVNSKIREAKRVLEDTVKVDAKKKEYVDLTEKIKEVDDEKTKKLSEAKMPVEGLSWKEDKVLYNKIPYNQISAAEQLRVSMAIAMASNPKLKVILIRDGSLLDKDNMKVIGEMAKDKDFQVFIEAVDDSGKTGIVIENGEVKKIN
ncbi:AAA family ATPase [Candidatus Babeliales bacterium]|nr:AAA family ATPase [Candidatus Babeliales bacterium]